MPPSPQALPQQPTDCHFHIFDDRFPIAPGRAKRMGATVADYLAFQRELGLSRGVIIAPSSYGHDNACLLDALARFGSRDFRAVIIPTPGADPTANWAEYHAQGVRGLRLYTGHADFPAPAALTQLAARVADRGWHLQLVGEPDREPFPDLVDLLGVLPCQLVFDHFGFAPQPNAARSRTADALRRLLDTGRTYVKLSGMYVQSRAEGTDYEDFDELARDLVGRAPERMLWGSDWPHTLAKTKPDGRRLLQRLDTWAPQPQVRERILVRNPADLYWAD